MGLKEQACREMMDMEEAGTIIALKLTPVDAWCVLSQLQLASRHPANTGPSAKAAKQIAEQIEEQVVPTPALKELARRGWDPEYDVP